MADAKNAKWQKFTPEQLSPKAKTAFDKYKEAYKLSKEFREAFEEIIRADAGDLPTGKRLIFHYGFGNINMAVVDDDAKPSASVKTQSLAAWLKQQG